MTRHEAQALVIAAIGTHPAVRRIDYDAHPAEEGVVVTVRLADGDWVLGTPLATLAAMTIEEYRAYFGDVLRTTEQSLAEQRGQV